MSRKAVVIGAGFGGLALAIRLQSAGLQTTLVERRDKPGGRAYVFEQDGFTFDAGPTVITDPACLEELFTVSGRKMSDYVELLPVDPFYRLMWPDGRVFDYGGDQAELDRQIETFNPADIAGYRKFLAYSKAVYEEGYRKLGQVAFLKPMMMLKVAPQLMKLQAFRSVYAMVAHFIRDPHLRQAFSFHTLLVGGSPFRSSSIYALIHALERRDGVWFARGGTGALIRGMTKLFTDLGGEVRLSASVERITTEAGRATGVGLESGEILPADMVASNADVVHTYDRLLGDHARGQAMGRRLRGKRHSMSLFVVYFGLKTRHPDLRHHTIVFGPRYKGLISEIVNAAPLASDFSLYLHAPGVTDASLAPEGSDGFYVLSPVPNLKREIDWDVEGPAYADRMLDELERRCIPNLRRDLVTLRTFSPKDFHGELNAHLGSAFSLEPILTQSAYFRVHNQDDKIKNLFFVGAGTHPGAGVPGVVGSAKATASVIVDELARGAI